MRSTTFRADTALVLLAVVARIAALAVLGTLAHPSRGSRTRLARNELVVGQPVLSSMFWVVAWRRNNPLATGAALAADGRPMLEADGTMLAAVWGRPELKQDAIFRSATLACVEVDPGRALGLTAVKFGQFGGSDRSSARPIRPDGSRLTRRATRPPARSRWRACGGWLGTDAERFCSRSSARWRSSPSRRA
ncbi:MAG: hypothetical protein KGJ98_07160 [Chloroflexota bacterium]|nr:hypothetical protein [Chloroflexota bacterium]